MKGLHNNASNTETAKRIVRYYTTEEIKTLWLELMCKTAADAEQAQRRMDRRMMLLQPENSMELTQEILLHLEMSGVDQLTRDSINENINTKLMS